MTIHCIDIGFKDVYIEYDLADDSHSGYFSFTRAKAIIFEAMSEAISYECVDEDKAVNFLNSLLSRYKFSITGAGFLIRK